MTEPVGQPPRAAGYPASEHRNRRLDAIDQADGLLVPTDIEPLGHEGEDLNMVYDRLYAARVPFVEYEGLQRPPGFCFTDSGNVQPWVWPVCGALSEAGFDGEDQVFWLTAPNEHLNDVTPLAALYATFPYDVPRVLAAVAAMRARWEPGTTGR